MSTHDLPPTRTISPEEMGRQADLILCSHEHLDHFDQPALKTAAAEPSTLKLLGLFHPENMDGAVQRRIMVNMIANFSRNELLQYSDWILNDVFRSIDDFQMAGSV